MSQQIVCPHCSQSFEPTQAYKHELEEKLLKQVETKYAGEIERIKQEKMQLEKSRQKEIEKIKNDTAKEESLKAKQKLAKELQEKEQLINSLQIRAKEAEDKELEIRKEKLSLEESKQKFELEMQRKLDTEREAIRNKAVSQLQEQYLLKDKEKELVIDGLKKALAEAQRKATQGSQQTQGEALELSLEQQLKKEFPTDKITEIKKGQRGADITHEVIDKLGRNCGTVLYEAKNAKWNSNWIGTLKDNQRRAKAHLAVLVTSNPPDDIESFIYRNGVWITTYEMAIPLAVALRFDLVRVNFEKQANINKTQKAEVLYQYITSTEFKHRIESIVEAFSDMQSIIETEKRWFTSKWAKQEKQIRKILDNTIGMRSDIEGLAGESLPKISALELPLLTEEN